MKLKVCGLTQPDQMKALCALRVSYLGLIFDPESVRYAGGVDAAAVRALPRTARRVGVFVNAKEAEMLETAERFGLDCVQLHGEESPEVCARMARHLPVIKAFGVGEKLPVSTVLEAYSPYCELFMFDALGKRRGGNGHPFDWNLLADYPAVTPFLLAGGIGPDTRMAAPPHLLCAGLDVNSRFEASPGIKRLDVLEAWINQNGPFDPVQWGYLPHFVDSAISMASLRQPCAIGEGLPQKLTDNHE